ncbi:unnamed protein product [Orchesella dallaii]|uniref:Uncharacterized protein n=1 Tax=Orchesella dallaii TaxID=48710 RepID=A0ABP1PVS8_9HEXA
MANNLDLLKNMVIKEVQEVYKMRINLIQENTRMKRREIEYLKLAQQLESTFPNMRVQVLNIAVKIRFSNFEYMDERFSSKLDAEKLKADQIESEMSKLVKPGIDFVVFAEKAQAIMSMLQDQRKILEKLEKEWDVLKIEMEREIDWCCSQVQTWLEGGK